MSNGNSGDMPRKVKKNVLAWSNVTVFAPKTVKKKWGSKTDSEECTQILSGVNGYCASGTLTAVMGASGAGKTTLLTTVSQRARMRTEGQIMFNGRLVTSDSMANVSGFVPQNDIVFTYLTVTEHMQFMANLILDRRLGEQHRNERISCLLNELGLQRCSHTALHRLSGGEFKRVSLAVQLLDDPLVLFCDEPTTGLDSYSAEVVLKHLRSCAERGKVVLATIHQPASDHFHLFHQLILISVGRVAYNGSVDNAESYFNSLGLVCPLNYNPAEFYIKQLALLPGHEFQSYTINHKLCDAFMKSTYGKAIEELVMQEVAKCRDKQFHLTVARQHVHVEDHEVDDTKLPAIIGANFFIQIKMLLWRSGKKLTNSYFDTLLRLMTTLWQVAIFSLLYSQMFTHYDQSTVQSLQGLLTMLSVSSYYAGVTNSKIFAGELPIVMRELANRLYNPLAYYISKVLFVACWSVVEATLLSTLCFWILGLKGGPEAFFLFVVAIIAMEIAASGFGLMVSAWFQSMPTMALVTSVIDLVVMQYSGIFISISSLPSYLAIFKYVSLFFYNVEALSVIQWRYFQHIDCSADADLPCLHNGLEVLEMYDFTPSNYNVDLIGMFVIYFVTNLVAYRGFYLRSQRPVY